MAYLQEPTDYSIERNRLMSFNDQNWKLKETISTKSFTEAGLFYVGEKDIVKCAWCHVFLSGCKAGDHPMAAHYRKSPTCPFVIQVDLSKQSKWIEKINLQLLEKGLQEDLAWQKHVRAADAVKIVKEMGYDYETIMKAVENIPASGNTDMNTDKLLDEIFHMEGQANNEHEVEENEENLRSFHGIIQRSKTLLKAKTKDEIVKEAIKSVISVGECVTVPKILCTIAVISYHQLVLLPIQNEMKDTQEQLHTLTKENSSLKKELDKNKQYSKQLQCKVCLENEVTYIFMPCYHLVCCEECKKQVSRCPVCRSEIKSSHKTFMC